jgi:signal transduction histidine kinase
MLDLLDVYRGALFLAEDNGRWSPVFARGIENPTWPAGKAVPETMLMRRLGGLPHPCFQEPWLQIVTPLVSDGQPVGVALLGPKVPDEHFNALEVSVVEQVVGAMAVTASSIRLFESSRAMSRRLLHIQEQERTYLAALLHDEPLQRLTVVTGRLDGLAHQVQQTPQLPGLAADLRHLRTDLLYVVRQMRQICADLHSPLLDQGIGLAVQEVMERLETETALDTRTQIDIEIAQVVPERATTAIYHALVEALNNVRKHARASWVGVTLTQRDGEFVLTVEDDGQGLNLTARSLSDLMRGHHFGLMGMHEWARLANGQVEVGPRPTGGTVVHLKIPCQEGADEATAHGAMPFVQNA